MLSAATVLRTRTASCHRDTEAAYADFNLTERRSYTLFLQAHSRAVSAAERALAATSGLPHWRPRALLLEDDLDALDALVPLPLSFPAVRDVGTAWGVLYVLEGSRIGSELLCRRVPQDLPRSYLAASHGAGEWRAFRAALGEALADGDEGTLERAVAGAISCFTLFAIAARNQALDAQRDLLSLP
jgi:heme oxygenase